MKKNCEKCGSWNSDVCAMRNAKGLLCFLLMPAPKSRDVLATFERHGEAEKFVAANGGTVRKVGAFTWTHWVVEAA